MGEYTMSGFLKLFGVSAVSVMAVVTVCSADMTPATGRGAYANVRAMSGKNSSPRMPSMPTITIPGSVVDMNIVKPQKPAPTPTPEPEPEPEPEPTPDTDCPDGGVRNSEYTVENCMDDLVLCVNGGALPDGMADLYDASVREDVFANMGLCRIQVEKCIADVRVDCENVYETSADVWYDFNLRRVQPQYYDFVLRKTGLTPYQAKNTCLLLDRNTYGHDFTAVDGNVTDEYNNVIGAYNSQENNSLTKDNPLGAKVNEDGLVDAERGHYARWDAKTATCFIRVAAYNKDKHITNSWLFGAAGNNQSAEVWQPAGSIFKCNKDLFGFSLMNDTKTVATVAIPTATALGAGVGAGVGAGTDAGRVLNCDDETSRQRYVERLRRDGYPNYVVNTLGIDLDNFQEDECNSVWEWFDLFNTGCECHRRCGSNCDNLVNINISGSYEAIKDVLEKMKDKQGLCERLRGVFCNVPVLGGGGNAGMGAAVGAGVGVGAGGIATAITALVEHNNISCRVGDGLASVPLGKSHEIGTLRDIYIKWGLRLLETIEPALDVRNCQTWRNACASLVDANQCRAAIVNYRTADAVAPTVIQNACVVKSDGKCGINKSIAKTHGVCVK